MKIIKYPQKSLLEKSIPVEINKELTNFIEELQIFSQNLGWGSVAGLAAPQVGKNIRVFLAQGNIYINPELTPIKEDGKRLCKEGCYSLEKDKFDYPVERYNSIKLKWMTKKGEQKELVYRGMPAQILQHEYDHLEGKLCCGEVK